jgi:hypothetical protein
MHSRRVKVASSTNDPLDTGSFMGIITGNFIDDELETVEGREGVRRVKAWRRGRNRSLESLPSAYASSPRRWSRSRRDGDGDERAPPRESSSCSFSSSHSLALSTNPNPLQLLSHLTHSRPAVPRQRSSLPPHRDPLPHDDRNNLSCAARVPAQLGNDDMGKPYENAPRSASLGARRRPGERARGLFR